MDPQVELWQRQAAEAISQQPEREEQIRAKLADMMSAKAAEWATMAQTAINDHGADPEKVSSKFNTMLSEAGFQLKEPIKFEQGQGSKFSGKVAAGSSSTADEAYDPSYGETEEEFYDRKERESKEASSTSAERKGAQADVGDAFKYGAQQGAARVLKGLGVDTNIEAPLYPEDAVGNKAANMLGAASLGLASMTSMPTAVAYGLTQGSAGAQESMEAGASVPQALTAGAVEAALTPVMRAIPASMGGSALIKTATGAGIGLGTGVGSDALLNAINPEALHRDLNDPYARAADVLLGAAGGIGHKTSSLEEAFKAGEKAATSPKDVAEAPLDVKPSKQLTEQLDMFSPNKESALSVDMFSGETVPASLMEQRRLRQERAAQGEEAQRTPEEAAQLEKDYILDQQEKLGADAKIAQTELPLDADLANFGIPEVSREPARRTRLDADGNVVNYSETGPNTAMRDAMRAAGERRTTGLQNQDMFNGPYREEGLGPDVGPKVFEPSTNKIVKQEVPTQAGIDFGPEQTDMFGGFNGGKPSPTLTEKIAAKKASKSNTSIEDLRKQLQGQKSLSFEEKVQVANARRSALEEGRSLTEDDLAGIKAEQPTLPMKGDVEGKGVKTPVDSTSQLELDVGGLTVGNFLDRVGGNLGKAYAHLPQTRGIARYMRAISKRVAGDDISIIKLTADNPEHLYFKDVDGVPLVNKKGSAGFYDPKTDTIYLNGEFPDVMSAMHEITHGLTSRAMLLGSKGKLSPSQQRAYASLDELFQEYKPELQAQHSKYAPKTHESVFSGYGLTNNREFVAEFMSNPFFRETLKNIPIKKTEGIVGKIKNLYDAVRNNIAKVLGLPEKAANALDLFSQSIDRFALNLNEEARTTRWDNRKNIPSTKDFGLAAGESPNKQKPRSKFVAGLKAAVAGRGVDPTITLTKERLSGEKQEIRAEEVANINKAISSVGKLKGISRQKADSAIATIFSDTTAPEAKKAMSDLREISPELADQVKQLAIDNYEGAGKLVDALLNSQVGKDIPDQKILNFAKTIIENRGKWSYRSYSTKEAQRAKYKLATKAADKVANGKKLSDEEATALKELNDLKGYIKQSVYGGAEALSSLKTEQLRGMYEDAFGNTQELKGLDSKTAKQHMINKLAARNASFFNKDGAVDQMVRKITGLGNDKVAKYYSGLKYGKDTLKAKEFVPAEIRQWWGEIEDPLINQIKGRTIQRLQLSEARALNDLRAEGLAKGLFSTEPGMGHDSQITGASSGALQDLYTTPDVAAVVDSVFEFASKPESLYESLVQGQDSRGAAASVLVGGALKLSAGMRAAKTATTVGNTGAWIRNAVGSPAQLWSNGNFLNFSHGFKGMKVTKELLGLSGKKELGPEAARMLRLGLAEATQTHETYSPRVRSKMDKLLKLMGEDPNKALSWVRSLSDAGGATADFVKEAYGAMDLWTKHANFYYEHSFQKAYNERHGIKMSDEQLDRMVADRIKQTNITYSRSPAALKAVESLGVTRFANYYYETFRTTANNMGIGMSDVAKGIKEGDVGLIAHGTRRIVGTAGAVGYTTALYTAALKAGAAALGFSVAAAGDDLKEYMKDNSFMDPDSTVMVKDGDTQYGFDVAMTAPYDPVHGVTKELALAASDKENAAKHLERAKNKLFDLMSNNSLLAGAIKAAQERTPSMARTDSKLYEQLLQQGLDKGNLSPSDMDKLINLVQPLAVKTPQEVSRAIGTDAEGKTKTAIGSGIGVYEVNPEKDIKTFLARSFRYQTGEARKTYSQLMSKPVDVTPEKLESYFKKGMEEIVKPYSKLEKGYKAALENGSDKNNLLDDIADVAGDDVANMLEDGELKPAQLIYRDLQSQADRAIENAPEKDKQKVEDLWYKKLDMLDDLMDKYEDLTLEDIRRAQNG